jgi:hypothetical protein
MRTRPFAAYEEPTCAPQDEARLRKNGSYPSGHATVGWVWALILAEVDPARADAILARGRSYGESRLVCNVHWQSDIIEGGFLGAAVVSHCTQWQSFARTSRPAVASLQKHAQESGAGPRLRHGSRSAVAEDPGRALSASKLQVQFRLQVLEVSRNRCDCEQASAAFEADGAVALLEVAVDADLVPRGCRGPRS